MDGIDINNIINDNIGYDFNEITNELSKAKAPLSSWMEAITATSDRITPKDLGLFSSKYIKTFGKEEESQKAFNEALWPTVSKIKNGFSGSGGQAISDSVSNIVTNSIGYDFNGIADGLKKAKAPLSGWMDAIKATSDQITPEDFELFSKKYMQTFGRSAENTQNFNDALWSTVSEIRNGSPDIANPTVSKPIKKISDEKKYNEYSVLHPNGDISYNNWKAKRLSNKSELVEQADNAAKRNGIRQYISNAERNVLGSPEYLALHPNRDVSYNDWKASRSSSKSELVEQANNAAKKNGVKRHISSAEEFSLNSSRKNSSKQLISDDDFNNIDSGKNILTLNKNKGYGAKENKKTAKERKIKIEEDENSIISQSKKTYNDTFYRKNKYNPNKFPIGTKKQNQKDIKIAQTTNGENWIGKNFDIPFISDIAEYSKTPSIIPPESSAMTGNMTLRLGPYSTPSIMPLGSVTMTESIKKARQGKAQELLKKRSEKNSKKKSLIQSANADAKGEIVGTLGGKTYASKKYKPNEQTIKNLEKFRGNHNQLGEADDPANSLMSKYDEALEKRRQAVKNKDEKAYSEASEEMHKIANSYEDETGYNFVQERQWRKRGTTSRYGKTPEGLAKYATLNPNSTEAKILENIANGEGGLSYEKLSGLEGKYSSTVKTLERYGFNKNSVESASDIFADLKTRDLKGTGLTTKDIAKTELGTKSEAYGVVNALKEKQSKLDRNKADATGNAELIAKLKKEKEDLEKGINNSIASFNKRFGGNGAFEAYSNKVESNSAYVDKMTSLSKLTSGVDKPKSKGETSAGFRKRMNEKLGYSRGGKGSWGKVGTAVVATSLVAGTLAMMMGSNKGEQSNAQLYGQQPIY